MTRARGSVRIARLIELFWLLLLVPLIAGLLVQRRVRSVFARYRAVANRAGLSGAELARRLLDAHGLGRVLIETTPGFLTDHYDGSAGRLRLSEAVAGERSVAALGIAAHEVSHAYQDAEGSRVYRVRVAVGEPLARLAPFSGFFFIGGFWFDIPILMALSIAYVAGMVLFALATLPVEFGASRRALGLLRGNGLTDAEETGEVGRVLKAAALTYVVGLLQQLGLLFALVLIAETARRAVT
jgi:Zn-dependent membrane protease YugP